MALDDLPVGRGGGMQIPEYPPGMQPPAFDRRPAGGGIDDMPIGGGPKVNIPEYPPGMSAANFASMDGAFPEGGAAEESFSGPLESRLAHRNFKARKAAYEELAALVSAGTEDASNYEARMKGMIKDVNAIALEAGVDCVKTLVKAIGPAQVGDLESILTAVLDKGLAGARSKSVASTQELLSNCIEEGEAAKTMASFAAAVNTAKAAKHKQQLSSTLLKLADDFGAHCFDARSILTPLAKLVSDTDDKVRKSARVVIVYYHQLMGPSIVSILEGKGVKPSTIAEINKDAADPSIRAPEPTKTCKGAPAGGIAKRGAPGDSAEADAMLYDEAEPHAVLKNLPKDCLSVISDHKAKWADKKNMVDASLLPHLTKVRLMPDDYGDLVKALKRALSDPNTAMVGLAMRCFFHLCKGLRTNFAREARILFPTFLDHLKEKKTAVADPLKDTLFALYQHNIVNVAEVAEDLQKASVDKVIPVRLGVLVWMERCVHLDAERAAKCIKIFAPIAVKILDTDADSGVKEQATKLCAALVKQCGEPACAAMLGALPQKTKEKVLRLSSGGAVASSLAASASAVRRPGTSSTRSRTALSSSVSSAAGLDASTKSVPKLSRTASSNKPRGGAGAGAARSAAPATKSGSEETPPPLGRSDAESGLEAMAPDTAAQIIAGLTGKSFKERQEAVSLLGTSLEAASDKAAAVEVATSLFNASTPGWKDSSFLVIVEMINVTLKLCPEAIPPRVLRAVIAVVDKLQDAKIKRPARELLTKLSEGIGPNPVVAAVISALASIKGPKTIQEALEWLTETLLEFGGGSVDETAVAKYALACLEMPTPAIKTGALELVAALARCSSAASVVKVARAADLRPALLKQVEDKCAKAQEAGAVVPKRATKNPAAAPAKGGLGGPQDIRSFVDATLLDRLSNSSWAERENALQDLLRVASGSLKPEVGPDLVPALRQRLNDTNKNIIPLACSVIAELFDNMGPGCRQHGPKLLPSVVQLLGDQKPNVRAGARKVLAAFDKHCGLEGLLPFLPKAMSTDVPSARQELTDFLVEVFNRDADKLPQNSLTPTVQPLVSFLQDKHPATRKAAEELLKPVILNVGFEAVARHISNLGAANQRALQPILDKNKQFSRPQGKPVPKKQKLSHITEDPAPAPASEPPPAAAAPLASQDRPLARNDSLNASVKAPSIYEDPMQSAVEEAYKPKTLFKGVTKDAQLSASMQLPSQTPAIPRQAPAPTVITTLSHAIELLTSSDIELALRAAHRVQEEVKAGSEVSIDQIMLKAMTRLTAICTDASAPLDVPSSRALVFFMTEVFQPPLSLQCKVETMYYLIGAVLDNLLTEKLHVAYKERPTDTQRRESDETLRCLNSLMLKLLERSSRTPTFCALIKRLDMYNQLIYNESSRYVKYVELVATCLLKLIRFVTRDNSTVDYSKLLEAVHQFLTDNPPTNFKGKMELPLRTVKTLLTELVKVKGESIKECLVELKISENALISEYITMSLTKTQGDQAATAHGQGNAAPSNEAGRGCNAELASQLDGIFARVRKTDTSREGVRELYNLMQGNPTLDITPWLSECSAPFQGFLQRQLQQHQQQQQQAQQRADDARYAAADTTSSMQSIRERMIRVRQAKASGQ
ncbi:Protein MOR1 [Diplonema papillatum]|nr:Protein MOR1 [Diplonema papillatum]